MRKWIPALLKNWENDLSHETVIRGETKIPLLFQAIKQMVHERIIRDNPNNLYKKSVDAWGEFGDDPSISTATKLAEFYGYESHSINTVYYPLWVFYHPKNGKWLLYSDTIKKWWTVEVDGKKRHWSHPWGFGQFCETDKTFFYYFWEDVWIRYNQFFQRESFIGAEGQDIWSIVFQLPFDTQQKTGDVIFH